MRSRKNSNYSLLRRPLSGTTLIELTVAMAILTVLIGMVAAISYNYLTLSTELVIRQRQEMRTQAFLDWIRRSFGNLPGNTVWQITSSESQSGTSSSPIISDMVLQEFPLTLMWNDMPVQVKAVRLRTFPQSNGLLRLDLECYDEEIFDPTNVESTSVYEITPIATTTLLEDLRWCEWMVRSPNTDEWNYELLRSDSRPYQLQLNMAFGLTGENTREVFWVPPMMDPKLFIQEMIAGGQRSGLGNRGNGSGGGGGDRERPPGNESGGERPAPPGGGEGAPTREGSPPQGGGQRPAPPASSASVEFNLPFEVERLSGIA